MDFSQIGEVFGEIVIESEEMTDHHLQCDQTISAENTNVKCTETTILEVLDGMLKDPLFSSLQDHIRKSKDTEVLAADLDTVCLHYEVTTARLCNKHTVANNGLRGIPAFMLHHMSSDYMYERSYCLLYLASRSCARTDSLKYHLIKPYNAIQTHSTEKPNGYKSSAVLQHADDHST